MRFAGRIFRIDKYYAVEVSILGIVSQGRTRKEAYEMIADAVESLVDKLDFRITVYPGKGEYFEISASDETALTALLLRRQRMKAHLTLAQVAERLGVKSLNTYARYEQGRSTPTLHQLLRLMSAVKPKGDLVIGESLVR